MDSMGCPAGLMGHPKGHLTVNPKNVRHHGDVGQKKNEEEKGQKNT